ncbi:hypothetical protein DFJ74DRAFT_764150 [Hyaloraphidium curvatum]|nr:hypothetical protein DFJ74DRAFT_764150 [Hyaloraphidium curvatum]
MRAFWALRTPLIGSPASHLRGLSARWAAAEPRSPFWPGIASGTCERGASPLLRYSSPATLLPTRCFSSDVLRGEDPLGRLRKVLQSARSGRIPPRDAADRVWEAYTALGSARGLDSYLAAGVAHHLAAHAVQVQASLRGKGKAGNRDRAEASLDQAAERMARLFTDVTEAGIAISPFAVTRFVQLNDRHLGSYAECRNVVDFLRLRCRVTLTQRTLSASLRNVAHRGNYTAFLRLLYEELTASPGISIDAFIINLFLKAVGREDVLNDRVVTVAVEAFCAWKHPRCVLATSELLATPPFPIAPRPATFNVLLADACDRRDAVSGEAILECIRQVGLKPDLELFNTMILFYGRTGRLKLAKETLKEMVTAGYKPSPLTGMAVLEGILGPKAEDVERAMDVLLSQQDLSGLMRVYGAMTVPPDRVTVSLMAKALADLGGARQMTDFLKSVPPHLIGTSETWSAAITSFTREWASSGDFVFRDTAFALSCAVLDHTQLTTESLPAAFRELPFVDMHPPVPAPGLILVIFVLATRLRGEQLGIITDKGRAYLRRNGHAVPDDAEARTMLARLQRLAGMRAG